jgi:hypothetical protein
MEIEEIAQYLEDEALVLEGIYSPRLFCVSWYLFSQKGRGARYAVVSNGENVLGD